LGHIHTLYVAGQPERYCDIYPHRYGYYVLCAPGALPFHDTRGERHKNNVGSSVSDCRGDRNSTGFRVSIDPREG